MLTRLLSLAALLLLAFGVIALAQSHWLALAYVSAASLCWLLVCRLAKGQFRL